MEPVGASNRQDLFGGDGGGAPPPAGAGDAPPVSRDIEMYEEAMQAWLGGGGIKRMLATINEDRARGAAKVKSAR